MSEDARSKGTTADEAEAGRWRWQKEQRLQMSEWQPIETAPKDGANILLLFRGVAIQGFASLDVSSKWVFETADPHNCYFCGGYEVQPTHWMLLPEAPNE